MGPKNKSAAPKVKIPNSMVENKLTPTDTAIIPTIPAI